MNAFSTPTPKRQNIKDPDLPSPHKKIIADIVIRDATEIITMDSKFGVPRIGENMNKLGIHYNSSILNNTIKI